MVIWGIQHTPWIALRTSANQLNNIKHTSLAYGILALVAAQPGPSRGKIAARWKPPLQLRWYVVVFVMSLVLLQSNQIPIRLGPSILRGKMLRLWVVQWSCWKALQDVRLECARTEHRGLQKLHLSNVVKCGSWSPLCAVRALDDSGHWCVELGCACWQIADLTWLLLSSFRSSKPRW